MNGNLNQLNQQNKKANLGRMEVGYRHNQKSHPQWPGGIGGLALSWRCTATLEPHRYTAGSSTFHNFGRQIYFGHIPQPARECKYQQAINLVCSDFWVPSLAIKYVNAKHPILQGPPNISWLLTPRISSWINPIANLYFLTKGMRFQTSAPCWKSKIGNFLNNMPALHRLDHGICQV
jgi:hypothetical protein